MDLFAKLQAITSDADCRGGCAGGSGSCGDEWFPGAADTCNAACGRTFERKGVQW